MENQTRYDLNTAIENWRQELAAQAGLTLDVRRELETHLRDAITGFQQRGLNDEESFWLARRRVGQPQQLGEEFVKADPAKIWRERIFWMAIATLTFTFWSHFCGFLEDALRALFPDTIWLHQAPGANLVFLLLFLLPLLAFALFLTHNRIPRAGLKLKLLLKSRIIFCLVLTIMFLTLETCSMIKSLSYARLNHAEQGLLVAMLLNTPLPLIAIALATWFLPTQNRKTPKRA
jgi:hypothetical protein